MADILVTILTFFPLHQEEKRLFAGKTNFSSLWAFLFKIHLIATNTYFESCCLKDGQILKSFYKDDALKNGFLLDKAQEAFSPIKMYFLGVQLGRDAFPGEVV